MRTILVLRPGALGDALLTLPLVEALLAQGTERVILLGTPASWRFLRHTSALEIRDLGARDWLGLFAQDQTLPSRARALLAEIDDALVLLGKGRTGVAAALRAAGVGRVAGAAPAALGAWAPEIDPRIQESERHPHPNPPSRGRGKLLGVQTFFPPPLRRRVGRGVEASPMSFLARWPPAPAHAARRLMTALAALDDGADVAWPGTPQALAEHPLLRLEPREIEQALRALNLAAPPPRGILALHPGSGGAAKCWPAKRFAGLATAAARHWGVLPVFLVGPADALAWHQVQEALPSALATAALVERPLREVLALLSLARAYVGNDSGISHLAGRACPTLALFGPSDPRVWHPLGHRVALLAAAGGDLTRLAVADVLAALERLLAT